MEIIKEFCAGIYVIRTNTYGHTWGYFNTLLAEAIKDFPELDNSKVEIVQFAGRRYARTFGIQFVVDKCEEKSNKNYSEISNLEFQY